MATPVDVVLKVRGARNAIAETKRVRAELEGMNARVKVIGSEMSRSSDRGSRAWAKLRRANWAMRGSFLGLGVSAGYAIQQLVGSTLDFETQTRRAATIVSRTGVVNEETYQRMARAAAEGARVTKFSNTEAAAGLYELAAAGFTANQSISTLKGTLQLAAATGVDVEKAAIAQSAVLNQFNLNKNDPSQAVRVANVFTRAINASALEMEDLRVSLKYIGPVANALGMSFEDTTTAIALLAQQNIKGSQAGRSLRMGLIRMIRPTKMANEALEDMGLTVKDLQTKDGQMKSFPELLSLIRKRTEGMTKAERNATISRLVGADAASSWIALINQNEDAWDKMSAEINNSKVTAEKTSNSMNKTIAASLERLKGNLEAVTAIFILKYSPALQEAFDRVSDWIWKLQDANSSARRSIRPFTELAENIWGLVKAFAEIAWPYIKAGIAAVVIAARGLNKILGFMNDHMDLIVPAMKALVFAFIAYKTVMFALRVPLMIVNGLIFAQNVLLRLNPFGLVVTAIALFVAWIILAYKRSATFRGFVNQLWDTLKATFNWIRDNWVLIAGILTGGLIPAIVLVIRNFDAIKSTVTGVVDWLLRQWRRFVTFFDSLPGKAAQIGGAFGKVLANAVIYGLNRIIDGMNSLLSFEIDLPFGKSISVDAPDIPQIPYFAQGGRVLSGGYGIVGEAGPELVNLPSGSSVVPMRGANATDIGGFSLGSITSSGTIVVPVSIDGREVARAVHRQYEDAAARR